MDKELVKLYALLHAIEQLLANGNCMYIVKTSDGRYGKVEYQEIYDDLYHKIEIAESEE